MDGDRADGFGVIALRDLSLPSFSFRVCFKSCFNSEIFSFKFFSLRLSLSRLLLEVSVVPSTSFLLKELEVVVVGGVMATFVGVRVGMGTGGGEVRIGVETGVGFVVVSLFSG